MTKQVVIIGVLVIAVLFVLTNLLVAAWQASKVAPFWQAERSKLSKEGDIQLVALGDSSTQAIGASEPMKGFVGLGAVYIYQQTGRDVHINNLAEGGASLRNIADTQIPKVNLTNADIVLVCAPSDFERRVSTEQFTQDMDNLLDALPADKTIISDLPLMPGRDKYQSILATAADKKGILRADFAAVFNGEGRRLDIFSWLPPHLNDRGYSYWFKAFQRPLDILMERKGLTKKETL